MRNTLSIRLILLVFIAHLAACSSSLWDELPENISIFVDKYFPATKISEAQATDDGFTVSISNGPLMNFGEAPDYAWTDIDGRGAVLPEMLITDQLPDTLLNYLREMEVTGAVYAISRTWRTYRVQLLNDYVTYDIHTATVTYPELR